MSGDFLLQMAQSSRERSERARALCPEPVLRAQAAARGPAPPLALSEAGFDLIAELKLRSPAHGPLSGAEDGELEAAIRTRVQAYAAGGAAMVSVLTEPTRFDGALSHLEHATAALAGRVPVLRKDFLVDRYQVYEARAAGAGGVLLILRLLDDRGLATLLESCIDMRLFALLEAFDEADLERAGRLLEHYRGDTTLLVGLNSRDLQTLQVDAARLVALAPRLPSGVSAVAESGIESGADAARCARAGYDLALVGGALMKSTAPEQTVRSLLSAGRAAVAAAREGSSLCR